MPDEHVRGKLPDANDRQPAQVVSVRFAPEELNRLKALATREDVPLSTVIRRAVLSPTPIGGSISRGSSSTNSAGIAIVGDYTVYDGGSWSTHGTTGEFNVNYAAGTKN